MNWLEALARTSSLVWVLRGADRIFEFANDAQALRLGFNPKGQVLREVHPSALDLMNALNHVDEQGKPFELREAPLEHQGRLGFFNLSLTPLKLDARVEAQSPNADPNDAVDAIVVVGTDVTDLVETKIRAEALAKEHEALKRVEERLSFGFRSAQMGMYEIDLTDLHATSTPEAERIFGHENLTGNFVESLVRIVHPDDMQRVLESATFALQSGKPCDQIYRVVKKDGSIAWIQSQGDAYRGQGDAPIRFYAVIQDVTERIRAEEDLKKAKEEAERASAMKSAFLANMSHEIRTPLGAILGFTELMKDRNISETEKYSYLDIVSRNGQQLTKIINDVLDLSKISAGELTIENVRCQPQAVIDEVIALLGVQAREKGIELRNVKVSPLPDVIGTDPTRFRQIVMNIVANAIKFTPRGFVAIQGGSEPSADGGLKIFIEVEDSGIGIPEDQRSRLFKDFTQADESMTRKFGGTGLGLALSKRLAKALGGDVFLVRSEPHTGSLFRIEIMDRIHEANLSQDPVIHASSEVASGVQPPAEPASHAGLDFSNLKVLLVEDSPDNQHLVTRILKRRNATVELANNGLEGFEMACAENFDLILMDVQMPVMDGYSATRKLREVGNQTPIIALTAHVMNQVHRRCLDAGCSDYLPKPINSQDLIAKIAHYANLEAAP